MKYKVTAIRYEDASPGAKAEWREESASSPIEAARLAARLAKSGYEARVYTHSGRRSSRSTSIRFDVMSCKPAQAGKRGPSVKGMVGAAKCKISAGFKRKLKRR